MQTFSQPDDEPTYLVARGVAGAWRGCRGHMRLRLTLPRTMSRIGAEVLVGRSGSSRSSRRAEERRASRGGHCAPHRVPIRLQGLEEWACALRMEWDGTGGLGVRSSQLQ